MGNALEDIFRSACLVGSNALIFYGPDHQIKKCLEEMNELKEQLEAPTKDFAKIFDEIADVWFTTLQMGMLHGGTDQCLERLKFKVKRLQQRIEESEEKNRKEWGGSPAPME